MQKQITYKGSDLLTQQNRVTHNYSQPQKIYEREINKWVLAIQNYGTQCAQILPHPFSNLFYSQAKFKLHIVFDNVIARVITDKLCEIEYLRFSQSQPSANLLSSQSGPRVHLGAGQKWIYLFKISQLLFRNDFISQSKYKQISSLCSPQNSVQKRLTQYCKYVHGSQTKSGLEQIKMHKVSLKKWKQIVQLDCRQFWTAYIYVWKSVIAQSKIMKKLYEIFQNYLSQKLGSNKLKQIKSLLNIVQPVQQPQQQYLSVLAKHLNMFNNTLMISKINSHIQAFMGRLKLQFLSQNKSVKEFKYETYGSFRSKICLYNSDVDITIFISQQPGKIQQDRSFICKRLWKVYNCLKFQRQNQNQFCIQTVSPCINQKIKVPFIRVNFQNHMILESIDLVINNMSGVNNSKMLQIYAQNTVLRDICILIKKWGKTNNLITIQRLSSYGITLMALYFFMRKGYLNYLNHKNLLDFSFSKQFKKKPSKYTEILLEFFNFYSINNPLYQEKQVVCLLNGCNDHQWLINKNFLINIHDPYEGSNPNPGRMKIYDKFKFFSDLDKAKELLTFANDSNSQKKKELLAKLIGFQLNQQIIQID